VKRLLIVIIAVLLLAAVIVVLFVFKARTAKPQAALPNPNGYEDFASAAQWLVGWSGDFYTLPPGEIRAALQQNAKALEEIHRGLKKQSAVPVANDMNWLNLHMVQLPANKQMAQLLVAEGLVHLEDGHTNEAARSFTACIVFAHAAHRRGLMIDGLLAMACQAIGARQLVPAAPHVSRETLREILPELISLDQSREPAEAIVQRDHEWSRGTYGALRMAWARMVMNKNARAPEISFEKKHARSAASLRLVITELALQLYRHEHGHPPAALADLVSAKILPATPLDPFSQQPLVYRTMTNSWLLYSVGPDGKDDGGVPLKRGETEKGDLLPTTP
jgi:hypothetical protein